MGHLNRPPKMHKSDEKFALVQSVDLCFPLKKSKEKYQFLPDFDWITKIATLLTSYTAMSASKSKK